MSRLAFATAVLAVGLLSGAARAQMVDFHALMTSTAEVPPKQSKGSGEVLASLDTKTKTLTYTITYQDLTGPATAAHFHGPAKAGANAGVMVPISGDLANPIHGTATLTAEQVTALKTGMVYVNVHTKANAGGEIRGQLMMVK